MKVGARRPPTPRVARGGPLLADRDGLQVGLVVPATTPPQDAAKRAAVRGALLATCPELRTTTLPRDASARDSKKAFIYSLTLYTSMHY
jgi:hypothetical protein